MTAPDLNLPALRKVAEGAAKNDVIVDVRIYANFGDDDGLLLETLDHTAFLALIARAEAAESELAATKASLAEAVEIARREEREAVQLLQQFANIAWHIRTNYRAFDRDDFEIRIGNDRATFAPFRAALAYTEAREAGARAAQERTA